VPKIFKIILDRFTVNLKNNQSDIDKINKLIKNINSRVLKEKRDEEINFLLIILIFLQNLNILSNQFETGTQGSIDGYMISFYIGIILSIVIILIQTLKRKPCKIEIKIVYFIPLIFSLPLYIFNFDFLYYVTIVGYSINDVITNAIEYGIAEISKDNNDIEKIYPVVIYLLITINIIVCFINILKKPSIKL
jgi:hypothetical protein